MKNSEWIPKEITHDEGKPKRNGSGGMLAANKGQGKLKV